MRDTTFGLSHVAGGSYAWLQPNGGWGLSNAGLVTCDQGAVLIDTLFDLDRTRSMLEGFSGLTESNPIHTAINTHGNGDHWFGNELLDADVRIIAAAATAADMRAVGPQTVASLLQLPTKAGEYGRRIFGDFDFAPIRARYPDHTYESELHLSFPGLELLLIDVGPAHTSGDTVVFCERDSVVFTGDIVFAEGTPIMWEGPVDNWLRACHRIEELGARYLVPGHGPISPVSRVRDMSAYLEFVREETTPRFERGMSAESAARDIPLGPFGSWPEAERLAANVTTIYRELSAEALPPTSGPVMFGCMAELRDYWGAKAIPTTERGGNG